MLKINLLAILFHKMVINKTFNFSFPNYFHDFMRVNARAIHFKDEGFMKVLRFTFTTRIIKETFFDTMDHLEKKEETSKALLLEHSFVWC
jgi:hypothetical protein